MHPEARRPVLATPGSAGYDLYTVEQGVVAPLSVRSFETGIRIRQLPKDAFVLLASRSGLVLRQTCFCVGCVIDQDFEATIKCLLYNGSPSVPVEIAKGTRVCQALVLPRLRLTKEETPLKKTRGKRGFGSSGL